MSDTLQLGLPLIAPAQAQKHVTVNEAFSRLDGLVQLRLESRSLAIPPALPVDGLSYAVPAGAVNAWSGQAGTVAIGSGGGWIFALPRAGWRGLIRDEGVIALHDGTDWRGGMLSLSPFGAGLSVGLREIDHVLAAGSVSNTVSVIPSHAMLIGVTARVVTPITGTLASWQLGDSIDPVRFGSGLGLGAGSWARGMLGSPMTYYAPEALVLSATGGDFAGGTVRIAVHFLEIALPSA